MNRAIWAGLLGLLCWTTAAQAGPQVAIVRSDYEALEERLDPKAELNTLQIEILVRAALDLLGGMARFVAPTDTLVVIKPNIVDLLDSGHGDITDPRVVRALVRLVAEVAPEARIVIGEGPGGWISEDHPEVDGYARRGDGFGLAGYRALLEDPEMAGLQVELMDLNFDEAVLVQVPSPWYAREIYYLPATVRRCNVLINVPVLKVTNTVGFTNAMKNNVGLAPGLRYGWAKMSGYLGYPGLPHYNAILDEMIVDLTAIAGTDLNVVDAIVGMERGRVRKEGGRSVRLNTMVAGGDPVAVDAVCARLIGLNPDDLEHITLGHQKGIGVGDLGQIEILGQPLETVATRFEKKPADARWRTDERGHYGQGNRTWLLWGPFPREGPQRPTVDPATLRPQPRENGWSDWTYFHDDKIDLRALYGREVRDVVVYAYAPFQAPRNQEAELWVGSDEGLRIWLNGVRVYAHDQRRRHRLPNDRLPVTIREGENELLVEVTQSVGRSFSFSLNLCEPENDDRYSGNRVFGLKFPEIRTARIVAGSHQPDYRFREPPKRMILGILVVALLAMLYSLYRIIRGIVRWILRKRRSSREASRILGENHEKPSDI